MGDQPPPDPAAERRARTRELARLILDEMDRPTSPEREASLARREREDAEALAHSYRLSGQRAATVAEAVNALAYAVETLPPDGPFDEIEVVIAGLCGYKSSLSMGPLPGTGPCRRSVVLAVHAPSGSGRSSRCLASGTNVELAAYLRRATAAEIGSVVEELARSLQRDRSG